MAYQRISAGNITKRFFNPDPATTLQGNSLLPFGGPYGEDGATLRSWAFDVEIGYAADGAWNLRPFIGAAYFQGHDKRADNLGQFFRNLLPFFEQNTSGAFNRLFSDRRYSDFLDDTSMSNVLIVRAGLEGRPLERVEVSLEAVWFEADERAVTNGLFIFPFLSFSHRDELGWEIRSKLRYAYSGSMELEVGYSRFFGAGGIEDGNFVNGNGLLFRGGMDEGDANYVYVETRIRF